jgi:hypothetical protein
MKLTKEIAALSFTLLASAITLLTLSGSIQKWAMIFTVTALLVHLGGVLIGKDEE